MDDRLLRYYLDLRSPEAGEWNLSPACLHAEMATRVYVRTAFEPVDGFRVCNVGIGTGDWDDYLGYWLRGRGRLTSIDIDPDICDIFAYRQRREGHPNPAEVWNRSIFDAELPHVTFDLVTLIGSAVDETGDFERCNDACMNLLKRGGHLMYMAGLKRTPAQWLERYIGKRGHRLTGGQNRRKTTMLACCYGMTAIYERGGKGSMLIDFDMHGASNIVAINENNRDELKIVLFDVGTNRLVGEIGNRYLPLGPRMSPDGRTVAFFSNGNGLYLYDFGTRTVETLFDHPDLNAGFCEWSPCGKYLCFSAYATNDDLPPDIYTIKVESRETLRLTSDDGAVDRFPQWSPCGRMIAFQRQRLADPDMPREICVVDIASRTCRTIPRPNGSSASIGRYCWSRDSVYLLIRENNGEKTTLRAYGLNDLAPAWSAGAQDITGGFFIRDGQYVIVLGEREMLVLPFPHGEPIAKFAYPASVPLQQTLRGPAVAVLPSSDAFYMLNSEGRLYRTDILGTFDRLLERQNASPLPMFTRSEYRITSRDGRNIPVHKFTPRRSREMAVLYLHGGPGANVRDPDDVMLRLLEEGYEVVVPAYRGCSGYGKDHEEANRGEYGRADVWDAIAAGAQWKAKTKRKLAIVGYSYGGYLTLLAMAGTGLPWTCGVTLWGVTGIRYLGMHLPRALPSDPVERERALFRRDPVAQSGRITVPLMMLHGGRDTTSSDSDVSLIGKNVRGNGVVCETVIYPEDTHGLLLNRDDMYKRLVRFLAQFE